MSKKNYRNLGATLLIAGTCIGAGMIGVPIQTALAGFYPTVLTFALIWGVMTLSALLFAEVALMFKGDTNLISMINHVLGAAHKNIAWAVYLILLYSVLASYTAGGSSMVNQLIPMHQYLAIAVFLVPFVILIYLGAKFVDIVNRFLTIGLIGSFLLLCGMTIFAQLEGNSFQAANSLSYIGNPKILIAALPMLITTFGYHIVIPSLKYYLQEEVASLKQAILIGGTIPLVVYVVWQLMVLLLMPIFDNSGNFVTQSVMDNNPADIIINYLMADGGRKVVLYSLVTFLFCALTSSLLGASLALKDFLADGLRIVKNTKGRIFLTGLTFVPPVLYSVLFPNGFLKALGFAGASCSILSIVYPAFMAWKLRRKKLPFHPNITDNRVYKVKLNNPQIMLICWFGIAVVVIQLVINLI